MRPIAIALLVVLCAYQYATGRKFYEQARWPENMGTPGFDVTGPWPSVGGVSDAAGAAGLRAGERVVAVQGQAYAGEGARAAALEKLFPGDRERVTVRSADGATREVSWPLAAAGGGTMTLGRALFLGTMTVAMPVLCLAMGFWAVLARPRDYQAWLLLGMLTCFSQSVVRPGYFPASLGGVGVFFHELRTAMAGSWPLFMFLFAWEFPRKTPWQERWRWAPRAVGAVLVLGVAILVALSAMTSWGDPARWADWIDRLRRMSGTVQLVQMLAIGCFFALVSYKRFVLRDADSVRRLRTILVGAMVSLTPLFVLIVLGMIQGKSPDGVAGLFIIPALMAMGLFPVTLTYVILSHRVFGLRVAVRQGLQYALARRGVRVLQMLLSAGVLLAAVTMATQPGMNRPRILQVVFVGAAVVLLLQKAGEWVSGWVDRRFFREAVAAEKVLASLSEDVRTMVETKPLLEAVVTRIAEALHVDRVALLLREGGGFQPAYATGEAEGLLEGSGTVRVLGRDRAPLRVYMEDRASWMYREGLGEKDIEWLQRSGAELLLPLAVKDKLLGIVSLGRKRSEEPYSGNDVELLQSVATQTGLALENSQLAAAMTEAVAQRERLNREVEIAQEVQERLFPQNLPAVEGLDYWGYCRPARGVGGDSYDFLLLEQGVFALSIGDVSGKGIPAALLMASLQSALRGQAMSMPADLGAMMGTLNRLIFDSSPSNRYATLFYGQFDILTRKMTYVNGGHNAPMVVRGKEIFRLEEGGPVVGLFRPASYTQGEFQFLPGDVLVGFTDGVSEAMNAADEEWGEEELGKLLCATGAADARALLPEIMTAADAFAAGAPQHDDMTLIAVRFIA